MGRMSANVARLLTEEVAKQAGVETDLIDIAGLPLPTDDAGEAIKEAAFSSKMDRADGLVIVAPEYNHGYSGLLKHILDSCLKEYVHKAVGIVGVSAGTIWRNSGNPKSSACHAGTWIGHNLLGCQLLDGAKLFRCKWEAARSFIHSAHR